jgi:hypothetical protein
MASSPRKKFRSKVVSHTELRNRVTTIYREKIPLTIWQGDKIRGALISNVIVGSYNIILKSNDEQELDFNLDKKIHLFGKGLLAQTEVLSVCNKSSTMRVEIPNPKAVRLTENRASTRFETVDLNIPLTLKTTDESEVQFGMTLVNLSRQGLAARMPHGRDARFISGKTINMIGFGRNVLKTPKKLTIGHITNEVHIKNFGPDNTVLGLQFSEILSKIEFIRLLGEITK